jgi:hypothetical protein
MQHLPSARIGDGGDGVSSDADGPREVVCCRYLMGRDKRGVSAKFLQRELAMAYRTAWTMAHKLRHELSEDPSRPLCGCLKADETFIGGRGDPTSRGRSTANPDKSLVVAAVEKVPAPKNKMGKQGTR